ncbi:MAG TPA: phosphatase PAP2 family protein [Bryobacteraceae bacterium]|nr:phosphatase PAP2 family protein [Bryobacteraceae bacterium]
MAGTQFRLVIALTASACCILGQELNTQPPDSSSSEDARDKIFYPGDTESVKPLSKKLLENVWLDQKQIWTSPFHMHKEDATWWILFGGATAVLIATDHQTSNIFENSKGQVSWGNHISNIGASYTLIPLVAGFYGYGVLKDDPKAREVGVLGGESLLDSLIVVEVLKSVAGRNRPDAPADKGHFFDGGSGFPSGHAIESWALASVITHEYGKDSVLVPIIACGLAGVVSAARFTAQRHYASDIVAGGAMGWFIGRYVYRTHEDHAIHKHGWMHPEVIPSVQPGMGTYAVGLQFGGR